MQNRNVLKLVEFSSWQKRLVLLFMVLAVTAVMSPEFFAFKNLLRTLPTFAVYTVFACGALFVGISGGIDLSIGGVAALSGSITVMSMERSGYSTGALVTGLAVSFAVSALIGAASGFAVSRLKTPSFVITLAWKFILYGVVPVILGNAQIYVKMKTSNPAVKNDFFHVLGSANVAGVPVLALIIIPAALVTRLILAKTRFGRNLRELGAAKNRAVIRGVSAAGTSAAAYALCSVFACAAGIMLTSINLQVSTSTADGSAAIIIAALAIGGVKFLQGTGRVSGIIFGAFIASVATNLLALTGVQTELRWIFRACVIVGALIMSGYGSRKSNPEFRTPGASVVVREDD
ncbi:MAG: ABC transporter permease [Oscillospiraceae bacterium]|jgi:ribose/xylose/arabinose/galactoside ABC-type transport system permease subunit|nr:ABC transporter permease [Oscillospiraceae bacterium]